MKWSCHVVKGIAEFQDVDGTQSHAPPLASLDKVVKSTLANLYRSHQLSTYLLTPFKS